jgi:hypothetical protein
MSNGGVVVAACKRSVVAHNCPRRTKTIGAAFHLDPSLVCFLLFFERRISLFVYLFNQYEYRQTAGREIRPNTLDKSTGETMTLGYRYDHS